MYDICVSKQDGVDLVDYAWKRPQTSDNRRKDKLPDDVDERFIRHVIAPKMPNQIILAFKDGVTYRAHPNFGGAPLQDFAIVKWYAMEKEERLLPSHLLAFLDLRGLMSKKVIVHNRGKAPVHRT